MNYFYIIKSKKLNKYYAGSRSSKKPAYNDLLKRYFTSSKIIKILIKENGIEDFIILNIKKFETYKECVDYENYFLRNLKNKNMFLNVNFSAGGQIIKSKTHTYITNDNINFYQYPKNLTIPKNYIEKWPFKPPSRKGYRKYTNGMKEIYLNPTKDIIPEGYMHISQYKKESSKKKNMFWINNGEITSKIEKNETIPNGWVKGRLNLNITKKRKTSPTKNKIAINNGKNNKFINQNETIPNGWIKGLIR